MNENGKMAGSVIFKLVGVIVGALVTFITAVGVAIFQAIENPTGKGNTASILDYAKKFTSKFVKKPKKK